MLASETLVITYAGHTQVPWHSMSVPTTRLLMTGGGAPPLPPSVLCLKWALAHICTPPPFVTTYLGASRLVAGELLGYALVPGP